MKRALTCVKSVMMAKSTNAIIMKNKELLKSVHVAKGKNELQKQRTQNYRESRKSSLNMDK
jgi:hypothetical protein